MESLRVKTDASARSRPSVYNIHFMLDKVVCHKQKMGSRKARQDLFQESVTKHNRTAVGKAKLNTQEVQALYFYDQAPATIQRMLKLIWGTQNPSQTAVPLTLVGRDFLLPKKSMSSKFPADTNPLWHEISKHTWDKVEEFFKRLETKWNFKLQEYYDRGQNPPINNAQICGPFRDSGKEAEVFMMASFVNHFEKELKHEMGDQEFLKFQTSWMQGTLDKRLMPEVTAARVDFRLSDLGLSGQDADMSGDVKLPDCFDCDDEEKEKLQDLISLARSLKKEQDTMRSYKANLARHQTASLAAERDLDQLFLHAYNHPGIQGLYCPNNILSPWHPGPILSKQYRITLASRAYNLSPWNPGPILSKQYLITLASRAYIVQTISYHPGIQGLYLITLESRAYIVQTVSYHPGIQGLYLITLDSRAYIVQTVSYHPGIQGLYLITLESRAYIVQTISYHPGIQGVYCPHKSYHPGIFH